MYFRSPTKYQILIMIMVTNISNIVSETLISPIYLQYPYKYQNSKAYRNSGDYNAVILYTVSETCNQLQTFTISGYYHV